LNFTYRLHVGDHATTDLFFNVKNLANSDPALVPRGPGGSNYDFAATNQNIYDILGRTFRAGVRFKM
jgi:iron complex outermembrane receptor protein